MVEGGAVVVKRKSISKSISKYIFEVHLEGVWRECGGGRAETSVKEVKAAAAKGCRSPPRNFS